MSFRQRALTRALRQVCTGVGLAGALVTPARAGSSVLELSALNGANGFMINGVQTGDRAGYAVSSVGDVNGDGLDDILIGAPFAPVWGAATGVAYLVYGRAQGFPSRLELSTLDATTGVRFNGVTARDGTGSAVSGAGDINGDGLADLLIGADLADPHGTYSGAAYVVFGQRNFSASLDLAALNGSNGLILKGGATGDYAGRAVSGVGDINGDGLDDFIVGAPYAQGTGVAYVIYGRTSGFPAVLELATLSSSNGFAIYGAAANDFMGRTASGAGDVNGDGLDDLLLGANKADPSGDLSGAAYVVFGRQGNWGSGLNLSSLNGTNGFRLDGVMSGDRAGYVVSAGDCNGDGFSDLLIGAPVAEANRSGAAYVVFGHSGSFASVLKLADLNGTNGAAFSGTAALDRVGRSVSSLGDVNGDGLNDLLMGALFADPNGSYSGAAYVVFGRSSGFASVLKLADLTGTNGFRLNGVKAGDFAGRSVSSAGDVNGDGLADLLVGASEASPNGLYSGTTYVVYGARMVPTTADVALSKTTAATAQPGANLNYTLSVTNNGPAVAQNLSVSDTLPTGAVFVSATGSNWTCGIANRIVTCNYGGTLGLGTASPITLTVQTPVTGGTLNNTATVSSLNDPTSSNNSASAQTVVSSSADVSLSNTAASTAQPGANLNYTLSVTNNGPAVAQNLSVSDTLPTGAVFVSATGSNWTCGIANRIVTCNYGGTLGLGTASPITLTVQTPVTGGTLNNTATVSSLNDPTSSNNSASAQTVVNSVADVSLSNTAASTAQPGANLNYTLSVTNNGPAVAQNLSVSDTLPTGAVFVSATGSNWTCGLSSRTVTCNYAGTLGLGTAPPITLTVQTPVTGGTLNNTATVSSLNDPTSSNNSASAQTVVNSVADVSLSNTAVASAQPGVNIDYTLSVTNNGPAVAQNLSVSDTLPTSAVFLSATGVNWTCEIANRIVTCNYTGTLGLGVAPPITVTIQTPVTGGTLNNTATVSSFNDPTSSNNSANVQTVVNSAADVSLSNTAASIAQPGTNLDYTLSVTNNGPAVAQNLSVSDTLPANTQFVSATGVYWTCSQSSSTVTCDYTGTLGLGTAPPITLTLQTPAKGGIISDTAIASSFNDPDATNNSDTAQTTVTDPNSTGLVQPLSQLDGSNGYVINGIAAGDHSGYAVSGLGDINGDGLSDLLLGAPLAKTGNVPTGAAYVVFGQPQGFGATVELSALNGTNGFKLSGSFAYDGTGRAVSGLGDINGDGLDDLIVGADFADPNGAYSGAAYVVFGSAAGFSAVQALSQLDGTKGFMLAGSHAGAYAGRAVGGLGDINGDGLADLIVGAPYADGRGAAYVVFGRRSGFPARLELAQLNGSTGFTLRGAAAGDLAGRAVSGLGDINGDGIADLAVGAPQAGGTGRAYVVFGRNTGFGALLDLATLDGSNGFTLRGTSASDQAGFAVSGLNDINGDGLADLLLGAPAAARSGVAYSVFGRRGGFPAVLDLAQLDGTNGFLLDGVAADDYAGRTLSGLGDVNNDGRADLLIGAPLADANGLRSGSAYVVYGKSGAFNAVVSLTTLAAANGFTLNGAHAGDFAGRSVSWLGDVNGDDGPDLLIGAAEASPHGQYSGAAYVVYGQAPPPTKADVALRVSVAATALPNTALNYNLTVSNAGPAVAQNVVVNASLPTAASFSGATGAGWVCEQVSSTVTCRYVGTLAVAASVPLTLTVQTPAAGGVLTSSANVTSFRDPVASNNSVSAQTVVNSAADVVLSQTVAASALPGTLLNYTLNVTNNGPALAQNLSISDTLPTTASFISATGTQWSCHRTGSTVSCTYASTLAAGATAPVVIAVQTPASGGTLTNTATLSATNDPNTANNSASAQTVVNSTADLLIGMSGPSMADLGAVLSYTLQVTNNGPALAQTVSVLIPLPSGTTLLSASGTGWQCTPTATTVTCSRTSALAVGAAAPLTLTLRAPNSAGQVNSSASVSASNDSNTGNNSARVQTTISSAIFTDTFEN